jgi:hypothetical protein
MKPSWIVAAMFLGASACSSTPLSTDGGISMSDAHRQSLCDGQQHLRLWALLGGGGQELPGSYVRIENGAPVFTVDGTCSYWVGGGWTEDALYRDRPFRTGRLSDADARSIEASVPIDEVSVLADCAPGGMPDASTRVIRTEMAMATCPSSLTDGVRFGAAWAAVQAIAEKLWQSGTPMDGALHVSAVGPASLPPSPSSPPAYAWPAALPLGEFVLDSSDWSNSGVSRFVDDPDAARRLRAMRDQYLTDRTAQPGLYSNWDGLIATDQTTSAIVYMRDAIPYEDTQGLLRF